MKFNWGYGILATIILFVGGILFMVYKSSQQKIELIEEDYYTAELAYQGKIDKKENLSDLSKEINTEWLKEGLSVKFPEIGSSVPEEGYIRLMRLSDKSMDREFSFDILKSSVFSIPAGHFQSGMYKMEVEWKVGEKSYLDEKTIHIP